MSWLQDPMRVSSRDRAPRIHSQRRAHFWYNEGMLIQLPQGADGDTSAKLIRVRFGDIHGN